MERVKTEMPLLATARRQGAPLQPPKVLALAACLGLAALAVGVRLLIGPHLRDDAYITLRYAANLASGLGFVYNPGEAVLGTSTPLYALLLGGLARAGLEPVTASITLGILSDALAVLILFRLAWQGKGWYAAAAAGLGYAVYFPLISHAVSGMETPLYSMVLAAACLAYSRDRLPMAASLAALAILLRPDGALLAVAIAAHYLWTRRSFTPWPVVFFLATLLPWAAFSVSYFGSAIPNSLLAKVDLGITDPLFSIRQLAWYFGAPEERWLLPSTLLGILGLRPCWRAGKGQQALLVWAGLYILAFAAANKFVYPIWPFEWYFVPLLAPLALLAAYGLEDLLHRTRAGYTLLRPYLAAAALVVFGAFYGLVAYAGYPILHMFVEGREGLYKEIAGRLNRYGATDLVAAPEIGGLGFYYRGPILDLHGLVSPQVMGLEYQEIVRRYRPPWLVSWDTLVPEELRAAPWFDAEYRPVMALQNWEGRRAILYRRYPSSPLEGDRGLLLGDSLKLKQAVAEISPQPQASLVRVRLDWQVLRPMSERYALFVHLLDPSGNLLAQQDNEPQEGTRPTDSLSPGHLTDLYDLAVGPGLHLAGARLAIGAYRSDDPSQHLGWRTRGGTDLGQELRLPLGHLELGLGRNLRECGAEFGQVIGLLGYSLERDPQGGWRLSLLWQGLQAMDLDYTVFVHALDGQARVMWQKDGPPQEGRFPTSMWLPGELVLDERAVPAPPQAPAAFRVGLYHLPSGRRLPALTPTLSQGERERGDSIIIDPALPGCRPSPLEGSSL